MSTKSEIARLLESPENREELYSWCSTFLPHGQDLSRVLEYLIENAVIAEKQTGAQDLLTLKKNLIGWEEDNGFKRGKISFSSSVPYLVSLGFLSKEGNKYAINPDSGYQFLYYMSLYILRTSLQPAEVQLDHLVLGGKSGKIIGRWPEDSRNVPDDIFAAESSAIAVVIRSFLGVADFVTDHAHHEKNEGPFFIEGIDSMILTYSGNCCYLWGSFKSNGPFSTTLKDRLRSGIRERIQTIESNCGKEIHEWEANLQLSDSLISGSKEHFVELKEWITKTLHHYKGSGKY